MSEMRTLTVNGKSYTLSDEVARERLGQLATDLAAQAPAIVCTASGAAIAVADAADRPLQGLKLFGKTVQGENPSPDAPQALQSIGDGGSVGLTVVGGNLLPYPYKETTLTRNGITFTDNGDGTITVNGTASAQAVFQLTSDGGLLQHGNNYIVSLGTTQSGASFQINYKDASGVERWAQSVMWQNGYELSRIYINVTAGAVFNNTIVTPMLALGSTAVPYEPYKTPQTFTMPTPNGLPGIPVETGGNYTDENGQQWICDELDPVRGVYVQRVGRMTLDGTETNLGYVSSYNYCSIKNVPNLKTDNTRCMCISTHFVGKSYNSNTNSVPSINADDGIKHLNVRGTGITSLDAFRSLLAEQAAGGTPVEILYILETPVETAIEPVTARSCKPTTTVLNDAGAHMELSYVADTKAYIDRRLGL